MTLIPLKARTGIAALAFAAVVGPLPAAADSFFFNTGDPDGRIGTLSSLRPGPMRGQSFLPETADDFVLSAPTSITQATFTRSPIAGSFLGGFRTPATVYVAPSIIAGIRNPAQKLP